MSKCWDENSTTKDKCIGGANGENGHPSRHPRTTERECAVNTRTILFSLSALLAMQIIRMKIGIKRLWLARLPQQARGQKMEGFQWG